MSEPQWDWKVEHEAKENFGSSFKTALKDAGFPKLEDVCKEFLYESSLSDYVHKRKQEFDALENKKVHGIDANAVLNNFLEGLRTNPEPGKDRYDLLFERIGIWVTASVLLSRINQEMLGRLQKRLTFRKDEAEALAKLIKKHVKDKGIKKGLRDSLEEYAKFDAYHREITYGLRDAHSKVILQYQNTFTVEALRVMIRTLVTDYKSRLIHFGLPDDDSIRLLLENFSIYLVIYSWEEIIAWQQRQINLLIKEPGKTEEVKKELAVLWRMEKDLFALASREDSEFRRELRAWLSAKEAEIKKETAEAREPAQQFHTPQQMVQQGGAPSTQAAPPIPPQWQGPFENGHPPPATPSIHPSVVLASLQHQGAASAAKPHLLSPPKNRLVGGLDPSLLLASVKHASRTPQPVRLLANARPVPPSSPTAGGAQERPVLDYSNFLTPPPKKRPAAAPRRQGKPIDVTRYFTPRRIPKSPSR
ncbi:MAG: hypothetical protein V1735_04195 [Nanoarchaeota archaeon]